MKKICLALDLKDDPGTIREYEDWHRPGNAWPEITQSIRDSGIKLMEIYRTGNRLMMIMETDDDFNPEVKAARDAASPKVQEWEQLMWRYQESLPWAAAGEKWTEMQLIYQLPLPDANV